MKKSTFTFVKLAVILFLSLPQHINAQSTLSNFDFENWTANSYSELSGWTDNNTYGAHPVIRVKQVPGVVGYGVRLQSDSSIFPNPGAINNGYGIFLAGAGGAPYTGSSIPTIFKGYYRYNMVTGDTARMTVILKKSGAILSIDSFFVPGSQPLFTAFSFPLTPISVIPDTVVFLALSGTFHFAPGTPGSFMELDQLSFSNGTDSLPFPHGDFDTWPTITTETPDNWQVNGDVFKTTDSHSGTYAAKLVTADEGSGLQAATVFGSTILLSPHPYVDTLKGYYKYISEGGDDADVNLAFWDHAVTGDGTSRDVLLPASSVYKSFSIPLNNTINATDFNLNIGSSFYTSVTGGSTLYIDGLQLKSGNTLGVSGLSAGQKEVAFYPMPCKDVVHVSISGTGSADNCKFTIFNLLGQPISNGTVSNGCISLQGLPAGVYNCTIYSADRIINGHIEVLD